MRATRGQAPGLGAPLRVDLGDHDAASQGAGPMGKVLLIILCFFFPFIAVLIRYGPCMKVIWALLLQLLGHIPGVIYGIYEVTKAD
jgi:uncharacterized membrane protein YqaE (UPF0057 family)